MLILEIFELKMPREFQIELNWGFFSEIKQVLFDNFFQERNASLHSLEC